MRVKPPTAMESVLFMLQENGMHEFYLKEIERRHTLFPKLVAALEMCREKLSFYNGEYKGGQHIAVIMEKVEALLKEAHK